MIWKNLKGRAAAMAAGAALGLALCACNDKGVNLQEYLHVDLQGNWKVTSAVLETQPYPGLDTTPPAPPDTVAVAAGDSLLSNIYQTVVFTADSVSGVPIPFEYIHVENYVPKDSVNVVGPAAPCCSYTTASDTLYIDRSREIFGWSEFRVAYTLSAGHLRLRRILQAGSWPIPVSFRRGTYVRILSLDYEKSP